MKLGFIGLGKMGNAMVLHLVEEGIDVAVFNRTKEKVDEVYNQSGQSSHLIKSYSIEELVSKLEAPKTVWLMVPQGAPVDEMIDKLLTSGISKGDIIIDGGNSFYKDSVRRYQSLKEKGINYLDIGTSGGLEGARNGACVMVGGDREVFEKVKPVLEKLAVPEGLTYFGGAGAGHFVKMVHNGVEYGMLESIGEGFDILKNGPYQLDLPAVSKNWAHGSVVRGWLMDLLNRALQKDPKLESIEGTVGGGTTGEWTVSTAKELNIEVKAIADALEVRKESQNKPTFAGKIIAALRNQFGGHEVIKK